MKLISYQREIPAVVRTGTDGNDYIVREAHLQTEKLAFTDSNKEIQIAEALKYSYNGEYTIEDDGQPEPEPTEQEQLRADVDFLLAMGGVL